MMHYRNAEFAEFGVFFYQEVFFRVLGASAVSFLDAR
jgi:hypothetical protein